MVYTFKAQGTGEGNTKSTHQYFISKPYGWSLWSRCMVPLTSYFSCGSSLTPVNVESCVRKVCVLERFFQAIAGGIPCGRSGQLVIAVRSQCAIWEACSQAAILESEHKVDIPEARTNVHTAQFPPLLGDSKSQTVIPAYRPWSEEQSARLDCQDRSEKNFSR